MSKFGEDRYKGFAITVKTYVEAITKAVSKLFI